MYLEKVGCFTCSTQQNDYITHYASFNVEFRYGVKHHGQHDLSTVQGCKIRPTIPR